MGREQLEKGPTHLETARRSADRAHGRVGVVNPEVGDPALLVADGRVDRDTVEHRVQRGPQALLRDLQRDVGPLALGDVAENADPSGDGTSRVAGTRPLLAHVTPWRSHSQWPPMRAAMSGRTDQSIVDRSTLISRVITTRHERPHHTRRTPIGDERGCRLSGSPRARLRADGRRLLALAVAGELVRWTTASRRSSR